MLRKDTLRGALPRPACKKKATYHDVSDPAKRAERRRACAHPAPRMVGNSRVDSRRRRRVVFPLRRRRDPAARGGTRAMIDRSDASSALAFTLPDGSVREAPAGAPARELVAAIG